MTKANLPEKTNPSDPRPALVVKRKPGETDGAAVARTMLEPDVRHGIVASNFAKKIIVTDAMSGLMDHADHVTAMGDKAAAGDLEMASRMLAAQAVTLDNMFTELARRAALNMADYPDAMDRYGRLALKAQGNCRATLDTLAKLHQPREQTVRHVHVNDGGQAIVADQFHHHARGGENAIPAKQSHATGTIGEGSPMSCSDALGGKMSVTGGEGTEAMPDAWRD
jgi:hypothetical protein